MISREENPGLFTVVVGVIALVFVGVGLSIVRDKQAKSGKHPSLTRVIIENASEITKLTEERDSQQRHYERLQEESAQETTELTDTNAALKKLDSQLATLGEERDALRKTVMNAEDKLDKLERLSKIPAPPRPATPPSAPAAPNPEIEQARAAVRAAALRVSTLESRISDAQSHVSRGEINVPGSLKTWKEVLANLTRELPVARESLRAKGNALRNLAPTDPLLRTTPGI